MKVIIPRVPKITTKRDLYRLATELLGSRVRLPFTATPRVTACEVIKITDCHGATEHHGMICIDSNAAGRWLVQQVQGKHLHSKMVFARQFVDRKDNGAAFHPLYERRRSDLEIAQADSSHISQNGIEVTHIAYPYAANH